MGIKLKMRGGWILKSILLAIGVSLIFSFDPVKAEDPLPEGEGRNLVYRKCQRCHGLDRIQEMRGSRAQWSEILKEMADNGLVLSDKDTKVILTYLGTHLGPPPKK